MPSPLGLWPLRPLEVRLAEIVDRHDVRMAEHGHRPGLAGEPLGKGRVLADLRREDFQGHQPVEPFLPGLVDHAHPAAAHQFQNLQVGEMGRQLGRRGRHEIGVLRRIAPAAAAGLGSQSAFEQTGRA